MPRIFMVTATSSQDLHNRLGEIANMGETALVHQGQAEVVRAEALDGNSHSFVSDGPYYAIVEVIPD